jgi:Transposase DDE domain
MCQVYCTITPSVVRDTAHRALARALPWRGHGRRVTADRLLALLLLAAALRSSLSAVCRRFRFGFSHEAARQAVAANLPEAEPLTRGLVDSLYLFLPRRLLRRRGWVIAIDEHRCPFYGDRSAPGVTGGQKKHGSKYAYAYATAALVHKRHRHTVGLVALTGGEKPHQVVAALLAQMEARGLRPRGVVLDSGFDSGETILLLQGRGLSYSVPLRKKGSGKNRRNAAWDLPSGAVAEVSWKTEETRKQVTTPAVVARRPGEKDKKVYAFGGWGPDEASRAARRASLARRWYRSRFGIETSYRQLNECKAKTTCKDVCYRLLLVGVALLLRQAWVWLTWQLAQARRLRPTQWAWGLPLRRMLDWLAAALAADYPEDRAIPLDRPIPTLDIDFMA